jgi:hypothetical protein
MSTARADWEALAARMRAAGTLDFNIEGSEVVTYFEGRRFVVVGSFDNPAADPNYYTGGGA